VFAAGRTFKPWFSGCGEYGADGAVPSIYSFPRPVSELAGKAGETLTGEERCSRGRRGVDVWCAAADDTMLCARGIISTTRDHAILRKDSA